MRKLAMLLVGTMCAAALSLCVCGAGNGQLSACSVERFADRASIVNTHAVAVTAQMGLFAGDTAGNFAPGGQVTRAQMATLIVKMLRGSDFNADSYKGGENPFTDTASFEGGWAEGYISACYSMGVVAGYGDGTFRPGKPVNTAEAMTMLINALGVDAGAGQWPDTVMTKGEQLGLYGALSPRPERYDTLVRDQLAVLVYEGVCCTPGKQPAYRVQGGQTSYATLEQAAAANGGDQGVIRVVDEGAVAAKVYGLSAIAFSHEWDAGVVTTPATTAKQGVKTYTCVSCAQTKTEDIPKLSGGSSGGGGGGHSHRWGQWTNMDEEKHIRTCELNGDHTQTNSHAWDAGVVTAPATESAPGVRTHTCTVCGAAKTQTIPALGVESQPAPGQNETPIG